MAAIRTCCAPSSCSASGGKASPVYSDINFILLGIALERLSGKSDPRHGCRPGLRLGRRSRKAPRRPKTAPGATACCRAKCTTRTAWRCRAPVTPACSALPVRCSTSRKACLTARRFHQRHRADAHAAIAEAHAWLGARLRGLVGRRPLQRPKPSAIPASPAPACGSISPRARRGPCSPIASIRRRHFDSGIVELRRAVGDLINGA